LSEQFSSEWYPTKEFTPGEASCSTLASKSRLFIGFVLPLQLAHAALFYQRWPGWRSLRTTILKNHNALWEIAEFVKSGKSFPNSIVMALPQEPNSHRRRTMEGWSQYSIAGKPEGIKI